MKSANPENEYIPLDLRISVRRDTLRLISEMAQDMGISINEVFSFLAEDSVIDLELMEDLNKIDIPSKCSIDDLKKALLKKSFVKIFQLFYFPSQVYNHFQLKISNTHLNHFFESATNYKSQICPIFDD